MVKKIGLVFNLLLAGIFLISCQKSEETTKKATIKTDKEAISDVTQISSTENRGKVLFKELLCFDCHGPDGKGVFLENGQPDPKLAGYPILAGQNADYMNNQVRDILAGKRTGGQTKAMIEKKPEFEKRNATEEKYNLIAEYLESVQ